MESQGEHANHMAPEVKIEPEPLELCGSSSMGCTHGAYKDTFNFNVQTHCRLQPGTYAMLAKQLLTDVLKQITGGLVIPAI